jgi:hypothetical protein
MRIRLVSLLCLILTLPAVTGQTSGEDWLSSYYKKPTPDVLVKNVRSLAKEGVLKKESAKPPLVAFFSRIMAQNPQQIDGWLTELGDLEEEEKEVLYTAAWFSDTEEARAYFTKHKMDAYLHKAPDILQMEADEPSKLDMFWGYFMATGDIKPIRRVVSALELSKYEGAAKRYQSSAQTDQDKKEAYLDATFQSAMWSLESNCRQHPLVLEHCEKLFAEEKLPKGQRLWLAVVLSKVKPEKYSLKFGESKKEGSQGEEKSPRENGE